MERRSYLYLLGTSFVPAFSQQFIECLFSEYHTTYSPENVESYSVYYSNDTNSVKCIVHFFESGSMYDDEVYILIEKPENGYEIYQYLPESVIDAYRVLEVARTQRVGRLRTVLDRLNLEYESV